MLGSEIRRKYIEFFQGKDHLHLPSDSLVPDDPSLLFTSAGMVQFKPYFTGAAQPPHPRAVTAQKCLRTDDIDEVGDAVHHTFFEMMGNFSFGDYFKREAIHFAWEFLTEWLKLPKEHIWTSVYLDDDEAAEVWEKEIGLLPSRIVRLGEDKNYWPANAPSKGPNGPCGPCNEIFLDMRPELGPPADPARAIAYDSNRFVEVWNLVFMQYLRGDGGTLTPLPRKNIDTGLGLERTAAILQGTPTNYESDLFLPLIQAMERLAGVRYGQDEVTDTSLRTIADHARAAVFCIADGVMPSNVKRGYVLRRMIRRAVIKARRIGYEGVFLRDLAPTVADMMGDWYPEIRDRMTFVQTMLESEEQKFERTLSTGLNRLDEEIRAAKAAGAGRLDGEAAFVLYDTFGFPFELTEELARTEGLEVDREGFEACMEEQRRRAQQGSRMFADVFGGTGESIAELQKSVGQTTFIGYEALRGEARVQAILRDGQLVGAAEEGDEVQIVLDVSPFYAEAGGQVGDTGRIEGPSGAAAIRDTRKRADIWFHDAVIVTGEIRTGDPVTAEVDRERRQAIMRNHTATHLLHAALRKVLGEHVAQSGSLVAPDRLRFDFSHFQAMTPEEIQAVEDEVNRRILEDHPVQPEHTTLDDARKKGAMALFGEKYGNEVRTIAIPDVSLELCGGTHLTRTSQIGLMKIVSEGSVAAGIRRIEAITGAAVLSHIRTLEQKLQEVAHRLQVPVADILPGIERLQQNLREHQVALEQVRSRSSADEAEAIVRSAEDVDGFKAVCSRTTSTDADGMSRLADILAERLGSSVVLLGSESGGKALFVAKVSADLVARGLHAGELVKAVAAEAGGGGGGRPEFAKAGGKDPSRLDAALEKGRALIREAAGRTSG
jgi:alanyl-tRNA synthetase